MIKRKLEEVLKNKLFSGKALILIGARQVGKTTLLNDLVAGQNNCLWLNGDELDVQKMFENTSADRLRAQFGNYKIVVIDEAQRIRDVSLRLKLITDQMKDIQLIATGSSAFELANKVNEPLTGRKWQYQMFPLSFSEMVQHHGLIKEKRLLPHRLVYGYYPEVVTSEGNEKQVLKQLTDAYLYKDILAWEHIKHPDKLLTLLRALAYQVGSQVSFNELGNTCSMDAKTVEKYIMLLEQCFVIFRLPSFSRNLRNELKTSRKIFFYDNGIRNALIADFTLPEMRQDIGQLWENFVISERMKHLAYNEIWANTYFWRTKQQQEIDYLEEADGKLHACEIKWNPKARAKMPETFNKAYPNTDFVVINQENIEDFVM
ncbi:MAG: ATP-binding protein [Bacteroidales bacterium]|nr:ATP-binding protein [Bacteroidales bacterium]